MQIFPKKLIIFFIITLFSSCNNEFEHAVIEFENEDGMHVHNVENISLYDTIMVSDSIYVLEEKLHSFRQEKLSSLNRLLLLQEKEYNSYISSLDTMENDMLVELVKRSISDFEKKIEQTKHNIIIYESNKAGTELDAISKQIKLYKAIEDTVLGYKFSCSFYGSEGLIGKEFYRKEYFVNHDYKIQKRINE